MAKVSIVVPCFNEEESLPLFFSAVQKAIRKITAEIEYWFIDDGSTDKTLSVIQTLQQKKGKVFILFPSLVILVKKRQCMQGFKPLLEIM